MMVLAASLFCARVQTVGSISSIVYSPTVKSLLAFAYIKPMAASVGQNLKVMIAGDLRSAVVLNND